MCELSLNIVPGDAKCEQYRRSASQACQGCEDYMPRGERPLCSVDGCDKYSQHGFDGMCKAHYRELAASLPTGPVVKPSVEHPDLDQDVAEVRLGFGKVSNADDEAVSFGTSDTLRDLIDHVLLEVRAALITDVSGMSTIRGAAHVLKAVEGMALRVSA